MTTPSTEAAARPFLDMAEDVIEQLALLYAHTPEDAMERSLALFGANVRSEWREVTKDLPAMTDDDIDGAVEHLLFRIRARRQQIEAAGAFGRA